MKRLALILFAALIAACSATAPHSDAPAAKTRAVVANVILKTSMDRLRNVTTDLLALYEERQARQEYDILGDGST